MLPAPKLLSEPDPVRVPIQGISRQANAEEQAVREQSKRDLEIY